MNLKTLFQESSVSFASRNTDVTILGSDVSWKDRVQNSFTGLWSLVGLDRNVNKYEDDLASPNVVSLYEDNLITSY